MAAQQYGFHYAVRSVRDAKEICQQLITQHTLPGRSGPARHREIAAAGVEGVRRQKGIGPKFLTLPERTECAVLCYAARPDSSPDSCLSPYSACCKPAAFSKVNVGVMRYHDPFSSTGPKQMARTGWSAVTLSCAAVVCVSAGAQEVGPKTNVGPGQCARLAKKLPDMPDNICQEGGLRQASAKSVNGVPLLFKKVAAAPDPSAKERPLRVMVLGGIHGDELSASSIVFHWLRLMDVPDSRRFEWLVVPAVNPDGLLAARPTRVNGNGVDLNRNFPTPNWGEEALKYWTSRTGSDPRRYPGRQPLSEPESRWIHDQMQRFKPDVMVSVHAPFGVLDFDGKVKPPERFGRLPYNKVGIYPGSLGNYGGNQRNVPVVTIELPSALSMPAKAEVERIWSDMLGWIHRNVPLSETMEKQDRVVGNTDSKTLVWRTSTN